MLVRLLILTFCALILLQSAVDGMSIIADKCPGREVPVIRTQAEQFEVSLVYYYVSWNGESSGTAFQLFNDLAQYYNEIVHFATVDCWHISCNCSHTGTPHKWPTLFVHYGRKFWLQYNGEWTFAALVRFVNDLFAPLQRVHDRSELQQLATQSDALVLGLFVHTDCVEYRKFAAAAVQWLETDPERGFRFVSAFAEASEQMLNNISVKMPLILLLNGKDVKEFNGSSKWDVNQIVLWLQNELKRSFSLINGYATPATIAVKMKGTASAVLALFVNDQLVNDNFYTKMYSELPLSSETNNDYCAMFATTHDDAKTYFGIQTDLEHQRRATNVCYKNVHVNAQTLSFYYHFNAFLEQSKYETIFAPDMEKSAIELWTLHLHNKCLLQTQRNTPAQKIEIAKFLKRSLEKLWLYASEHQNRTLAVVILSLNKYKDFLDAHGVVYTHLSAATALIADPQKESIFAMHEPYTYDALMTFVKNYYNQHLNAVYKTTPHIQRLPSALNMLYIHDFNRQMFLSLIQQQNTTIVALLYTPACALSAIMSQTLIQVSALLPSDIKIVRVNAQAIDLPWELVMPSTPTLIVFPRGEAAESRIFPAHLRVNVRNVFGFILAQLEPTEQVMVALGSCRRALPHLHNCLQFAKALVMQHIGHHLKLWQIFEQERQFVLERLKYFKDISLHIQQSVRF